MRATAVRSTRMGVADLPIGPAPPPVAFPHFPDRLHAFVWRNWQLLPTARLARVVRAEQDDILRLGQAMGLVDPPTITSDQQRRSRLTVIRRNWHLLPYEQLLELLGWTPEELAYTLREDDFLFIKLGRLKPRCEPVIYRPPDEGTRARAAEIARIVHQEFGDRVGSTADPLFGFVSRLSSPTAVRQSPRPGRSAFTPRFCTSYFGLYGDLLLDSRIDAYPDGYLARLAEAGVDGVWLQAVLYRLAPFPWEPSLSRRYEQRLENLRRLVARARRRGIGVHLYLNEPRAMPLAFYQEHPQLKGVPDGDHAALCTSAPEVQEYLREAVASVCRAVPDLAGLFTITASENLTNCWSHGCGEECRRCGGRPAADVIAEVNTLIGEGIRQSGSAARLIVWDWGWRDEWAEAIIGHLPDDVALMSVSEWSLPIRRGDVESSVGEYSLSAIGPGPRARRHWEIARRRGLKVMAKIQAANTWELSAVPYIPAVENTAQHVANLRDAGVEGLMLGWTLGGYPSPNLEVVAEMGRAVESAERPPGSPGPAVDPTVREAMEAVACRRFGEALAPAVVSAWQVCSRAFREFPFHVGTVYTAPLQLGPANLLWETPTGYRATMVGFPYDDLDSWRQVYPANLFIGQLERVADGFDEALGLLRDALPVADSSPRQPECRALLEEMRVAEAAAIHFRSVANQTWFVQARQALTHAATQAVARSLIHTLELTLRDEIALARLLYSLQIRDSRLGFEASNQYFYVPLDLVEKVLNCRDLLDRWLPAQRARWES